MIQDNAALPPIACDNTDAPAGIMSEMANFYRRSVGVNLTASATDGRGFVVLAGGRRLRGLLRFRNVDGDDFFVVAGE